MLACITFSDPAKPDRARRMTKSVFPAAESQNDYRSMYTKSLRTVELNDNARVTCVRGDPSPEPPLTFCNLCGFA
jgi:hypothetical protein